ncbi:MAG TPA: hypothetical protein PL045_06190 [Chitinophagaceae bacterium]|nr:hypothetical protein [Chitinophagaceae bacterium]
MASLKKQQKKLLNEEITAKVMEYLMGLSTEHEPALSKFVAKSAKKIVRTYYAAIKAQHRQAVKATKKTQAQIVPSETAIEQTNLLAS